MKSLVALIFAVALVEFASAVTKEYHDRAVAAKDKCAKEHGVSEDEIKKFMEKKVLPESHNGKCMIECYLTEMKLLVDGKANVEEWKASNKQKWEDADIVAKADKVVDQCDGEVSPDGKDKCEYATELTKCGLLNGMKEGIPAPDMEHPKRR